MKYYKSFDNYFLQIMKFHAYWERMQQKPQMSGKIISSSSTPSLLFSTSSFPQHLTFVPCSPPTSSHLQYTLSRCRPALIQRSSWRQPFPCHHARLPINYHPQSQLTIASARNEVIDKTTYANIKNHFNDPIDPVKFLSSLSFTVDDLRNLMYTFSALLTVYLTPSAIAATTSTPAPAPTPTIPTPPSEINDAFTGVLQDNTLISRVLAYTALILLIYVTIATIIVTINNFLKRRNRENTKKWIKARAEGDKFPSNMYLDMMKDSSLPADFPMKPSKKKVVKPTAELGNRQIRRETMKSNEKDKDSDKKTATSGRGRAATKKEAAAGRALRRAERERRKNNKSK